MTTEEINDAIAEALGRTREIIQARREWEEAERKFQGAEITVEEFYRTHLRVDPTRFWRIDFADCLDVVFGFPRVSGLGATYSVGCEAVRFPLTAYNRRRKVAEI